MHRAWNKLFHLEKTLVGQWAVNSEPVRCNGQLPYPALEGGEGGELAARGAGSVEQNS